MRLLVGAADVLVCDCLFDAAFRGVSFMNEIVHLLVEDSGPPHRDHLCNLLAYIEHVRLQMVHTRVDVMPICIARLILHSEVHR